VFTDVRCSFVELPAADVAKVIFGSMVPEERPDANGDWKSWADYHAWYCSQSNIPRHGRENRWPSLVWTETDEVLMDGWHRLHSYFRAGHATIPLVCADWETFWRRADVADRNFTT